MEFCIKNLISHAIIPIFIPTFSAGLARITVEAKISMIS